MADCQGEVFDVFEVEESDWIEEDIALDGPYECDVCGGNTFTFLGSSGVIFTVYRCRDCHAEQFVADRGHTSDGRLI